MAEVFVTVDPNGNTTIDVQGAKGASCTDLTKELEAAIGSTTDRKKKPEFFQAATNKNKAEQR